MFSFSEQASFAEGEEADEWGEEAGETFGPTFEGRRRAQVGFSRDGWCEPTLQAYHSWS